VTEGAGNGLKLRVFAQGSRRNRSGSRIPVVAVPAAQDGGDLVHVRLAGAVIEPGDAGTPDSPVDVVALVASAGGLAALNQVLLTMPDNFNAALVIVQHLGGQASRLAEILDRRSPLPVYVCPPQRLLEITPDAECSVRPMEPGHRLRPIDFFLASLARSYGRRAMVVVLTGMGGDSAAGSEAVSHASGTVLVQSPKSAQHPMMPTAVIGIGAADIVLPLSELGPMIADVVAGGARYRDFLLLVAAQTDGVLTGVRRRR
jgi:chemotaxis response regulator CheB